MLHSKLHPIVRRISIKENLFRMPFYIQTAFKINICGQTGRGHFIDLCSTKIYFYDSHKSTLPIVKLKLPGL